MKRENYISISGAKQVLIALGLAILPGLARSQTYTYSYTGTQQTVLLQAGPYQIQCWGANGGDGTFYSAQTPNNLIDGGKGGYSTGTITLNAPTTVYVNVGGRGTNVNAGNNPGGYNGGGNSSSAAYQAGSGGGASHVATAPGVLSALSGNQAAVLIVAGGGGGGGNQSLGGDGGGINGVTPPTTTQFSNRTPGGGGSQTAGGACYSGGSGAAFGQGGTTTQNLAGGGGGGWYGGCSGDNSTAGGGGSGYIGGVSAGTTAATGQPGFALNPDISGHGRVVITLLCNISLDATSNPICIGQSVTLSTDASGVTWTGGSSANSIVVNPTVTTSYSVTGTSTMNCTTTRVITVTVNPLPVISTVVSPSLLCVGNTATVVGSGADTYTWSTGLSGSTTTVNPGATSVFSVFATSIYGCLNSTTVAVNVNSNNITLSPATPSVCVGNTLNVIASGASTYTWSHGPMFPSVWLSPTSSTGYTVSGTDVYGCVIKKNFNMNVVPSPTVSISANKTTVCKGESVNLTGNGATSYSWSTGASGANVTVNIPIDIPYYFVVTGSDAGCSKTATIVITGAKCLGIENFNTSGTNVQVVPNPGSGVYDIRIDAQVQGLTMSVYNELGMLIKTQKIVSDSNKLDIQNEKPGIYFVRISEQGQELKVVKLIKE